MRPKLLVILKEGIKLKTTATILLLLLFFVNGRYKEIKLHTNKFPKCIAIGSK